MSLMDIASGMAYLHSVGILHGDLKSANVLLKSTATDLRGYSCKIADFGCGRAQNILCYAAWCTDRLEPCVPVATFTPHQLPAGAKSLRCSLRRH